MRRSPLTEILNRDIVPMWVRRWQSGAMVAFYLLVLAFLWGRAIMHWRLGMGAVSLAGIFAVIGTIGLIQIALQLPGYLRHRRQKPSTSLEAMRPADLDGECARCGYNLTGTASINCPECGAWHGRRRSKLGHRNTT